MTSEIGSSIDQQPIEAPARLRPVPAGFAEARTALHALAEQVISAERQRATGKIGLRATPGGIGTPPFGADDAQVRLEGADLVRSEGGRELSRTPADVDPGAAAFLADWYALGASVLLALRAEAGGDAAPSLIQLWPEHFDIAVELGSEAAGSRANYGFSPGDEHHPEPYLYVGPWTAPPAGALWNATGFTGAELSYGELAAAEDPSATALAFLRARAEALAGGG